MDNNSNLDNKTVQVPPRTPANNMDERQRQALINLHRQKMEQIYAGRTEHQTPNTTPISAGQSFVNQTVKNQVSSQIPVAQNPAQIPQIQHNQAQATQRKVNLSEHFRAKNQTNHQAQQFQDSGEHWKKYHAAWQNYYQKYYEKYYSAALEQHKKSVPTSQIQPDIAEELTEEQKRERALAKLKKDIANKAREKTSKIRKSRHFAPLAIAGLVVFTFLFLQYNRLIFANVEAYITPNNASSRETIQTPNTKVEVSADPRLIIPKINVDAPVAYGIRNDAKSQLDAMNNGLAHFAIPGANSVPGQIGNTVLSGHSSNDLFDGGDYKFIFAQLEKLKEGDIIYANYEGKQYSYVVRDFKVVLPTEVSSVIRNDGKPWLTLITCTPLGTAQKRLLVFAEQISPNPAEAAPAQEISTNSAEPAEIPRNSLTFFERLFTWNWS